MNKQSQNQSGFSIVEGLLIFIIIALVGFIGYYVWHASSKTKSTYDSVAKTASSSNQESSKKSGSDVITIKDAGGTVTPVTSNTTSGSTTKTTTSSSAQPKQQTQTYSPYMNISEWGVKIPTNSKYMGYRWDITDNSNNLVSVFITDDTNGLSEDVGCAAGNIQGVYVFKDHQYDDYNSNNDAVMPDANLNIGGHTYYIYKSICNGSVRSNVQNLASEVDSISLK